MPRFSLEENCHRISGVHADGIRGSIAILAPSICKLVLISQSFVSKGVRSTKDYFRFSLANEHRAAECLFRTTNISKPRGLWFYHPPQQDLGLDPALMAYFRIYTSHPHASLWLSQRVFLHYTGWRASQGGYDNNISVGTYFTGYKH